MISSNKPVTLSRILIRLFGMAAVVLTLASTANAQAVRTKIAFVDFEQVFTNYFKTKLANDQLYAMSDSINRERAIMLTEFDRTQMEYKDLSGRLIAAPTNDVALPKLREKMEESLVALRRQDDRIKKFNEAQQKRWDEQNRRIRAKLVDEIREKMAGYLKANGYLTVVDKSLMNDKEVPAFLYVDENADITLEIIAELNR